MAIYPLLNHVNFEQNAKATVASHTGAGFDGTTVNDATDKLTIKHYSELLNFANATPYHGAYCALVDFDGATSSEDAYFICSDNFALNATGYYSWKFYLSPDFAMADNTSFAMFGIMATAQIEVGIQIGTATDGNFYCGIDQDGGTPEATNRVNISLGQWHHVDVLFDIDNSDTSGAIDLRVDDVAVTQLATLTQAAGTDVWFGAIAAATTSGTMRSGTAGFMLLDEFKEATSSRIRPAKDRYNNTIRMDGDGHAFVGPGIIRDLILNPGSGASDIFLHVYDTDDANIISPDNRVSVLAQEASTSTAVKLENVPIRVKRGAYIDLIGTFDADGPSAMVTVEPRYSENAGVRNYARLRKADPLG